MGQRAPKQTVSEHIQECIFMSDFDTLGKMLEKLGVDYADKNGHTALHEAARKCNQKAMDFLLGLGANINVQDAQGLTPLAAAVENGSQETVDFLLGKKANPDLPDEKGITPLIKAVEEGEAGIVASLLTHGAEIDLKDPEGRTALMAAAQKGQAMIVGALTGRGASLTATDNDGNAVMHYAAGCQENDVTLRFLAGKGNLVNVGNNAGETPAIIAVKRHHAENLQALLDCGADPAIADKSGMNAVQHGRALKRVKFRAAMKEVLENEGEVARQSMRRGTEEKISVRKPLRLKKTASFVS